MSKDMLVVKGAREHNLKNIDVEIPRNKLVVITGLSGSGKSSLAFDTIYAEGQRRYVESLSAYARQFLGLMEKPDVDYIDGLSPAISIEQRSAAKNPRSTVGTVTEIHDYLRLLFARVGTPSCYKCGRPISRQTVEQVVDAVLALPAQKRIQVLAPMVRGRKGEYRELFSQIHKDGYVRVRVDGTVYELGAEIKLDKNKKHDIDVVIDRLVIEPKIQNRLADSVQTAFNLSSGLLKIEVTDDKQEFFYSEHAACYHCGVSYEEISPRMFSFNSPYGACPACDGLGVKLEIDPALVVPDPGYSLSQGAIAAWAGFEDTTWESALKAIARRHYFDFSTPFEKLPKKVQQIILYGSEGEQYKIRHESRSGRGTSEYLHEYEGVIPNLMRRYRETKSEEMRSWIQGFMSSSVCPDCKGVRLKPESLAIKIADRSIAEVSALSIRLASQFFGELALTPQQTQISKQILKEIRERLGFLVNVGLDYLTLDRPANTLAGGEAQRIRLATQIGSQLVGVLYVLDEPSIGLHQRDNQRLLNMLLKLRDLGNTVIVVEHDRATMEQADYLIDLGPGAGIHGGKVVKAGTPAEVMRCAESLTGRYLAGKDTIPVPPQRRRRDPRKMLTVVGAQEHNLKNVTAAFPLGSFICVTGVSGSGKSTLVNETLHKALAQHFYRTKDQPGKHRKITGLEHIDKVIAIDQSPIGRTPRSNPATYTGTFTHIRDLFAQLPESKIRGYQPGRFSFNIKGGRCEACEGDGIIKIEMHFLPDVYVPCEVCKGARYNRETLEIQFKGRSIADVLDMTVEEALEFFHHVPRLRARLATLQKVGLGYIHLGQAATTLSGGEAQRIKLSTELARRSTGRTMHILDEPTTGLHFVDIKMLLSVLQELVTAGNTVVVIEHNLDVIKAADYIIDMGPEGGEEGGRIVAEGTPEEVANNPASHTGRFLKQELQ